MIKVINLKNFKCFSENSLQLNELTILAGANAAGKSSIVQALLLAFSTINEKNDSVDASKAIGIAVGNPKALVSQNRIEIKDADFELEIQEDIGGVKIKYVIDKLSPLKLSFSCLDKEIKSRIFYLNAERCGPRISYPAGFDEKILSDGTNAAYLIDRADMQGRRIPEELTVNGQISKFSIHVEEWLNAILGDVNFCVTTDLVKSSTDIKYKNTLVDEGVLPTMTGFGISYILSIVTAALWCSSIENAVLIVENPEAHLHPLAQSRMGKFLELISFLGVQVIIETHSEHIIDGARVQAALLKATDKMKINFFANKHGKIEIQDITVDENGELADWPDGFFDQKSADLRDLFNIRRNNASK